MENVRKRRLVIIVISAILIIASIIFFIPDTKSTVGHVIAGYPVSGSRFGIAVVLFLAGIVLLLTEHHLEERIKYDPNIKSFRRAIEKTEKRKISYTEAKKLYENADKKYWDSIGKGHIKHYYDGPLELTEKYAQPQEKKLPQGQKKPDIIFGYLNDRSLSRLAQEASNNLLVERDTEHVIEELRKGNERPGMSVKYISGTDGIIEYRARRGARVYAKRDGDNLDVVGISSKSNQDNVINILKQKFPRK